MFTLFCSVLEITWLTLGNTSWYCNKKTSFTTSYKNSALNAWMILLFKVCKSCQVFFDYQKAFKTKKYNLNSFQWSVSLNFLELQVSQRHTCSYEMIWLVFDIQPQNQTCGVFSYNSPSRYITGKTAVELGVYRILQSASLNFSSQWNMVTHSLEVLDVCWYGVQCRMGQTPTSLSVW